MAQCDLLDTGRIADWSCHNIEHEVAHYYHSAHGAGLAIVIPAWMQYVYRHDLPRFARYAAQVWGVKNDPADQESMALEGIRRTRAFFESLGMPVSLADLGVEQPDCRGMAKDCIQLYGKLGRFVPLEEEDVYRILLSAAH